MPLYLIDGKAVLFVHIPKAGGTTIEFALEPFCAGFLDRSFAGGPLPCSPQHFHHPILKSVLRLPDLSYAFATVRHPRDRLKSEYRWRRKYFGVEIDFNAWVLSLFEEYRKNKFVNDNHVRPMHEFVWSGCEVFKLEEGLAPVGAALKAKFPNAAFGEFTRKEMSSSTQGSVDELEGVEMSSEVRDAVRRIYEKDLETFGYSM